MSQWHAARHSGQEGWAGTAADANAALTLNLPSHQATQTAQHCPATARRSSWPTCLLVLLHYMNSHNSAVVAAAEERVSQESQPLLAALAHNMWPIRLIFQASLMPRSLCSACSLFVVVRLQAEILTVATTVR